MSPVKSFFKVVLPVMKPAILGAVILMWVTSLAEISATIVLYVRFLKLGSTPLFARRGTVPGLRSPCG